MYLVRRARAALTVGVLWGVVWGVSGAALGVWLSAFGTPALAKPLRFLLSFMWNGGRVLGICGLAAGTAFAVALSLAERRRNVGGLSRWRAAALGGAAGVAAASVLVLTAGGPARLLAVADLFMGTVGAFSAATTVFLAQRAPLEAAPGVGRRLGPTEPLPSNSGGAD